MIPQALIHYVETEIILIRVSKILYFLANLLKTSLN